MVDPFRGRWESEAGTGGLAHVDVAAALPLGEAIAVMLDEQAWTCVIVGEQMRIEGEGTTMVVRAVRPGGTT